VRHKIYAKKKALSSILLKMERLLAIWIIQNVLQHTVKKKVIYAVWKKMTAN